VAADPFAQQMQQMQPMQGSAGKGGRPVAGVDGNWACPSCQNVNFATRTACNRCQTPKPAEDESFQWGGLAGGALVIPAAGAGAKGGGKGGPPMAGVDGNWACPGCQNVNFATRMACNRCQMPKPEDQFGGGGFGGFGAATHTPGGAPVAGAGGNWKCSMCQNVNFATRDACNRCAASRAEAEAPLPAGGFGGFGGGKAGGKGKAPVAGENGNWGCPGCGNVNFASREVCNRCQTPKPEEDAAAFASFGAADFGAADGGLFEQLMQGGDYADGQPAKRMKF